MPRQVGTAALLMYAGAMLGGIGPLYYGLFDRTVDRSADLARRESGEQRLRCRFRIRFRSFRGRCHGPMAVDGLEIRRGRNWARIVSVALFGLGTLLLLARLVANPASVVTVSGALSWLAGLGAIILLFQRPASAFFASGGRPPNPPGYPAGYGYQGGSGYPPPQAHATPPPRHDQGP